MMHLKCPSLPGISNEESETKVIGLLSQVKDSSFYCENYLIYDEQSGTCVSLEECPLIQDLKNLRADALFLFKDFIFSLDLQTLTTGDIFGFFEDTLVSLDVFTKEDLEKFEEYKDFDLIRNVIQENVGAVFHKYAGYMSFLLNPYLRNSAAVKKQCGTNELCVLKYIMNKNKKSVKKIFTGFLPDLIKGLEDVQEELQKSISKECKDDNCKFAREFLEYYGEARIKIDKYILPMVNLLSEYADKIFI